MKDVILGSGMHTEVLFFAWFSETRSWCIAGLLLDVATGAASAVVRFAHREHATGIVVRRRQQRDEDRFCVS